MSVRFEQAGDDGQLGGPDEIAAIAFSLSIPGLELADCTGPDSEGLVPAVIVPPAVGENLRVFVENLFCETRQSCLCPGEGEGREPFVNVVVFGPKDFPAGPPAEIPLLPEGELVAFDLRIAGTGTLPLHIYSELDDPEAFPPPPFTALLSVADREAVDRTADRTSGTSQVIVEDGEVVVLPCVGDCSEDARVGPEELMRCVRALLRLDPLETCLPCDRNSDGRVSADEIMAAVLSLLRPRDCPLPVLSPPGPSSAR